MINISFHICDRKYIRYVLNQNNNKIFFNDYHQNILFCLLQNRWCFYCPLVLHPPHLRQWPYILWEGVAVIRRKKTRFNGHFWSNIVRNTIFGFHWMLPMCMIECKIIFSAHTTPQNMFGYNFNLLYAPAPPIVF